MNYLQRGMTSILRKPVKSILLLIIVFILGNVIAGTLSIYLAVNNTERTLKEQNLPIATVGIDYNAIMDEDVEEKDTLIDINFINKTTRSAYVKDYDYTVTTSLTSNELKMVSSQPAEDEQLTEEGTGENENYFTIMGTSKTEPLSLKQQGLKILSGRPFTEQELKEKSYVAMISDELAELNGLQVGSKLPLSETIYNYDSNDTNEIVAELDYPFEVIGIYQAPKAAGSAKASRVDSYIDDLKKNYIYTTNAVTEELVTQYNAELKKQDIVEDFEMTQSYSPIYLLNHIDDLPKFKEEVEPHLPKYCKITDNESNIQSVIEPMKTMQWFAQIILIASISVSILILCLLIFIFLRERRHEIGIYLSLGETKIKIVVQIVFEVLAVALIAVTLSLFTGNLLSRGLSDKLLNDQIIAQQEKEGSSNTEAPYFDELGMMGLGSDITTEDMQESFSVKIDAATVLTFYLISIGIILLASCAPVIYLTRFNPKKVLL